MFHFVKPRDALVLVGLFHPACCCHAVGKAGSIWHEWSGMKNPPLVLRQNSYDCNLSSEEFYFRFCRSKLKLLYMKSISP